MISVLPEPVRALNCQRGKPASLIIRQMPNGFVCAFEQIQLSTHFIRVFEPAMQVVFGKQQNRILVRLPVSGMSRANLQVVAVGTNVDAVLPKCIPINPVSRAFGYPVQHRVPFVA